MEHLEQLSQAMAQLNIGGGGVSVDEEIAKQMVELENEEEQRLDELL